MKLHLGNVLGYALVISLCFAAGCAGRGVTPPARSAAELEQPDGGTPVPPASTKKGIIVPSDVSAGGQPPPMGPSSGTNDNGLGSPFGPAPGKN